MCSAAVDLLTPSELYMIGQNLSASEADADPGARELAHLRTAVPDQVSPEAISRAWGTSKPTLTSSYRPELLNLKTFPTLMGYSSRIMAESWESNQLYWAAIGDEIGRIASAAGAADSGMDATDGGANICLAPGGLARAVAQPAVSGRRCARG